MPALKTFWGGAGLVIPRFLLVSARFPDLVFASFSLVSEHDLVFLQLVFFWFHQKTMYFFGTLELRTERREYLVALTLTRACIL